MLPTTMRAWRADPSGRVLRAERAPVPQPGAHAVLVRMLACGVCRTDLHIIDGELPLLWSERILQSVANLTRADGEGFFADVARTPVQTHVETFPLDEAPQAVAALRAGRVRGAAVLVP